MPLNYVWTYRQPKCFCETSAEVTNYIHVFCETVWKASQKWNIYFSPHSRHSIVVHI